ncbi:histidinol phosphatase [Flavobacterium sp. LM5]|uniref:tyrosine-protein phosphatase n=1 Tax=Flavobacterium sp. LM5 TaxID=1938610 RepID=UPI0009929544|nr:CpsB/CapC family capsule biosynthesis tyrosine phosphatase [Flavobacterium sp. LM5]OOV29281.1 histidinol phosphatase [Flavobacterium sp. LM5]
MLHFFKTKPILKDVIPSNYIDIHSHLLPGIDDGATSMDNTITLTKELLLLGTKQLITTPHVIQYVWPNTKEKILSNAETTIKTIEESGLTVPFKVAAEYLMDDSFLHLFQNESLLTLKDNYVLVEMSYINAPFQLYNILFDLKVAGYIPVLAHPERYLFYHKNMEEYNKLKKAGCFFQLNLLATMGYYGGEISKVADKLLQKGMYDFVGSDVHHEKHLKAFHQKLMIKETTGLKEVISNNQFFAFD